LSHAHADGGEPTAHTHGADAALHATVAAHSPTSRNTCVFDWAVRGWFAEWFMLAAVWSSSFQIICVVVLHDQRIFHACCYMIKGIILHKLQKHTKKIGILQPSH
jgi:hypothetical protein